MGFSQKPEATESLHCFVLRQERALNDTENFSTWLICATFSKLLNGRGTRNTCKKRFMIFFMLTTTRRLTGSLALSFYWLLHCPSSALKSLQKVCTQDLVINLAADQLNQIKGEDKAAKKRNLKLAKKIEDLSKALKILKS